MLNLPVAAEGGHDVTTLDLQVDSETDVQVQPSEISASSTDIQLLRFSHCNQSEHYMKEHGSLPDVYIQACENFFDDYDIYIQFDPDSLPSGEAVLKPLARSLQLVRHWRNEGLLVLAWLVHVCIIWTLQALETSDQATAKISG